MNEKNNGNGLMGAAEGVFGLLFAVLGALCLLAALVGGAWWQLVTAGDCALVSWMCFAEALGEGDWR